MSHECRTEKKMTASFTKEHLLGLSAKSTRYYIADPKTPYLFLAVYEKTGSKIFFLQRRIYGKQIRIKIGSFDVLTIEQARKEAKKLNAQIELGGNPQKDKVEHRCSLTVQGLYERYYQEYASKYTKRPEDNRKVFEYHVNPFFGGEFAKDITKQHVRALHSKIGEQRSRYSKPGNEKKSYYSANRTIAIVRAVFNYGLEEGYIKGQNPCDGLKLYPTFSRDRFLSNDELPLFFEALKAEKKMYSDYFQILLYTGVRKSNAMTMEYAKIDYNLKRYCLAETQTKNKDVNIILLSEPVIKILATRESFNEFRKEPSPYVFPSEKSDGHLKDPKKAFKRIKRNMGVLDLRIHDLRRTLGSYMAINGASLPIIGKALNHKSQVSTTIYARLSQDPVLSAINSASESIKSRL